MIRPAMPNDYEDVCRLLATENLPTSDLPKELPDFFVIFKDNKIIGSIGLEVYGAAALLRSMIVLTDYRGKGTASLLVNQLISHAKAKGIRKLYLITNTAEKYFERKGFEKIERTQVDAPVLVSREFNGLCPASSTLMMKRI